MSNKQKLIKKIVIGGIILLIILPFYYSCFGIGYALKDYKFDRKDYYTWFWNPGNKTDDENPYPLELLLKKIPAQYAYIDFHGYEKEPNWYNYYIGEGSDIITAKEYETIFLYNITLDWQEHHKVFAYNERYTLPKYRDFKINTSKEDIWNEDHTEKEWFDLRIVGYYRTNLFSYRLQFVDIPPIKFNNIFNYKMNKSFPCKITIKYALDNEEPLVDSYDFIIKAERGRWWNPNAWWWMYL